jgi:hypothetical protein
MALAQIAPSIVLISLGRIGIFVVLQPKAKPIEIAMDYGMQVRRLPFDVRFVWEDVGVVRLLCIGQAAD